MDTGTAFIMGQASRNNPVKVFDWDLAAQIIRDSAATHAEAGLIEDWDWTGGEIFADGQPVAKENTYVYLASTWATPTLIVGGDVHDCSKFRTDTPGWHAHTFWPQSALDILATKDGAR